MDYVIGIDGGGTKTEAVADYRKLDSQTKSSPDYEADDLLERRKLDAHK